MSTSGDHEPDSDISDYDYTEWVACIHDGPRDEQAASPMVQGPQPWQCQCLAVDLQAEGKGITGSGLDIGATDLSHKCDLQNYDDLDDVIRDAEKSGGKPRLATYDVFGFDRDYMQKTLGERLRAMTLDGEQRIADFFDCYYTEGEPGDRKDASKYDCKDPPNEYMQSYSFLWELRDRDGFNK
ncbi:hypothetical protein N657DRAFT_682902 [Parathielavia appendiculata]|uniref:Uncharacterized protein n=1 Tax=Parathielavia appendiculata TaxID=2587402 RepID=A0AAN6TV51_9PEZI|nr:hypothetical protein N657DRAFT_682902 [Parathielavia appendiculata]